MYAPDPFGKDDLETARRLVDMVTMGTLVPLTSSGAEGGEVPAGGVGHAAPLPFSGRSKSPTPRSS